MRDPLLDRDFLYQLDQQHNREIFAKVVSLDFSENPIEEILGRVQQGSISIDGSSAVRRTCSLTLVANKNNGEDFNLHEYYWGMSQKIQVFVGLRNDINPIYPDIIWFPQGLFLITQFNTSQGLNTYSISIQGKDKMALLNGELGGNITSLSFDFGSEDNIDENGNITNIKLQIKDIIREVVHEYGREPYHNIVINDLEDVGLELMEYRGSTPLYLILSQDKDVVEQMTLSNNFTLYDEDGVEKLISNFTENDFDHMIQLDLDVRSLPSKFYSSVEDANSEKNPKTVVKCTYGDVVGYRITDLVYAGNLVGQVGNSVTSACLDNIVKMLGDFEYFYNTDGQFVFQKKKTYINTSFNNLRNSDSDFIPVEITEEEFESGKYYVLHDNYEHINAQTNISLDVFTNNSFNLYSSQFDLATSYSKNKTYYKRVYIEGFANTMVETSSVMYSFENSNLVTSFQNNPALSNVKNDFSIWGQRKSVDGSTQIPVHMRYAIDKKPVYYKSYSGQVYITDEYDGDEEGSVYDWRELIYQMALDSNLHGHDDDFLPTIRKNNRDYYPTGYTGYEQYYIDLEGFWRQLYYPNYPGGYKVSSCTQKEFNQDKESYYYYKQCTTESFNKDIEYYILDIGNGYIVRKNLTKEVYDNNKRAYYILKHCDSNSVWDKDIIYYVKTDSSFSEDNNYWNSEIKTSPETLNFWFDFLDADGQFSQYSCHLIGNRPKAINDNNIKSIYFRETPTIILVGKDIEDSELDEQKALKPGYTFFKVPNDMKNLFTISGQGQSAKDKLESLLYSDACCAESISINTIPVYYLEPNNRIFVRDDESGINGEYIVSKISYNLGAAATMSISATRAIERIY